ncbi:MAG: lysophospholipid acyltransferase family protein [Nocardioidaceae bacterium]
MSDAEIIPLGTRGQPGRGSGRKPSQSSRGLAPKKAAPKTAEKTAEKASAERPARKASAEAAAAETAIGTEHATTPEPAQGKPAQGKPVQGKPAARTPAKPAEQATEAGSSATGLTVVPDEPETPVAKPGPPADPAPTAPEQVAGLPISEIAAAIGSAAREVFGPDAERRVAEFLAFLRRRVTGDYTVDEYGLDPELATMFLQAAIAPLAQRWFRVEVRGSENIPAAGGALIVSNHSGTLPLDALVTMYTVNKHTGRILRSLGADLVFRLPFIGATARKGGATLACNEDATRMLTGGELVGVWPEGFKGIGKPYRERYKLQRFGRGGFVSAAVRTGVPIVPCSVVGAEEIYPLIANVPSLARLLGVPYIPITPFFPWLGLLGLVPLPSKWIIEFGEPIHTDAYDAAQADDPMLTFEVADQVRETIQQTLYTLLTQRTSIFG